MINVPRDLFDSIYDTEGSFGIRLFSRNNWAIEYCREMFALYRMQGSLAGEDFLFMTKCPENVIKFIHRIESKLPVDGRTKFSETDFMRRRLDRQIVIHVDPNKFWLQPHRHSLFTILLRIGKKYNPKRNNWRKVLENGSYLKKSQIAVRHFFKGYIDLSDDYKYHFNGWVSEFSDRTTKEIKAKLIKRDNHERKGLAEGGDTRRLRAVRS